MTTSIELHSNVRKDGRQLIQIKVSDKDKRIRASSKIYINKKYWKPKAKWGKWIKETHPEADELNKKLEQKIRAVKDQCEAGKNINPKAAIEGADFFVYAENLIKKYKNPKSMGTWKNYNTGLNKLETYLGKKELSFKEITVKFINEYCAYLSEIGNRQNTIWGEVKNIKAVYNQAIREDVVEMGQSPFFKVRIKKEKSKKERLTKQEIQLLRDEYAKEGSVKWDAKNIFLFCINTLGMRIGDAMRITRHDVQGDILTYRMAKTSDVIRVKLTKEAREIIKCYSSNKGKYIFPYLNGRKDIFYALNVSTALVNKNLKLLKESAGINKKVTTHVARHTWTQLAIDNKANPRTIQKALGHESFNTTEGYIKELSFNDVDEINEAIWR